MSTKDEKVVASRDLDTKVQAFLEKISVDLAKGIPVFASDSSETSETSETSESSESTEGSESGESGGSEDGEGSVLLRSLLAVNPAADEWGAILDRAAPVLDQLHRR